MLSASLRRGGLRRSAPGGAAARSRADPPKHGLEPRSRLSGDRRGLRVGELRADLLRELELAAAVPAETEMLVDLELLPLAQMAVEVVPEPLHRFLACD